MKKPRKTSLMGKWRIDSRPDFDKKDMDADGPAHFTVNARGDGDFHFLYVHGNTDGNFKKPETPTYDFTWNGNDECDEAQGDGCLQLVPNGTALREIRFHQSDTHAFNAAKRTERTEKVKAK